MKPTILLTRLAGLAASGLLAAPIALAAEAAPWTAADYANARPMLPKVSYLPPAVFDHNAAIAEAAHTKVSISVAGTNGGADARHLAKELPFKAADAAADTIAPQASGTGGLPFTSTRTFPNNSDKTHPTRTVGKLYFRIGSLTYVCSGAVIAKGVVLTSGHCVNNGSGSYYTDFRFIPGLRNTTAPYGEWTNWVDVKTTTAWSTGGGSVPNSGDWALIVFGPDGSGNRIGDYTGVLGYQTNTCSGRHQTILGYPQNLDSGLQMHRTDSQATSYGGFNNCTWGSDSTGGSSGGPVVLNLQKAYTSTTPAPAENNANRVVSTVSWGYVDPAIKIQGGSILNNSFVTLLNNICAANPGAC